jgi:carotenoid cleavage dioxygenase
MSAGTNMSDYSVGPYARVDDEIHVRNLRVRGEIPREIHGMFVQNSPNPKYEPTGRYHWFDGDGMVHGVALENGKATYVNRYIDTDALRADSEAERALTRGILEPIDRSRAAGPDKNTANTDLVYHHGKLLALWWLGGTPYELSAPDLRTVGKARFAANLPCGVAAHPKVDPVSGEMIFFDYSVYEAPYLHVGVLSADGTKAHVTPIEIPGPRLFHDIAITPSYTILLDLPMTWDQDAVAAGYRKVSFLPELGSRFGLLPRGGEANDVRWFEAPACYIYHTINAWEETAPNGDALVRMTACRIDNPIPTCRHSEEPKIPRLTFLRLHPFLTEWTFNLTTGAVGERPLDDVATEFPRMNDDYLGQRSRYAYHPRIAHEPTLLFDGFIKYDLQSGTSRAHSWGPNCIGGETVFVPRDGADEEDDGWVVTFVTDRRNDESFLDIVHAQDPSHEPVARIEMPRRVPFGFHSHWVPSQGLR